MDILRYGDDLSNFALKVNHEKAAIYFAVVDYILPECTFTAGSHV